MRVDADRFWGLMPRRRLGWRDVDEQHCVVLRPRLGEGWLGRWMAGCLSDPYYRIRLDTIGSFVWRACDGETSLSVIAERMRRHFGDSIEPVEERLGRFVQTMQRGRLITGPADNDS